MSNFQDNRNGSDSSLKAMELALQQAAVNGKSKKETDFKEAYPLIEQNLTRKIPFKTVLESFNTAYGYSLHPPRFRKLLLDERKRREEGGDVLHCDLCGQVLKQNETVTEKLDDKENM
jgi:hypothetical protein